MEYDSILYGETPLVVSPQLAQVFGLNGAIVLQQLHYWINKNGKDRDGHRWIYNSISDWHEQFPFFGVNTIRRILDGLTASKAVIKGDYNKNGFDKTSWWAIDYECLEAIVKNHNSICPKWANGYTQNGQIDIPKMGKPIPENTQRLTQIYKKEKYQKKSSGLDVLIDEYTQNETLIEALQGFIKMRAANKKPLTNRALEMLFAKLSQLSETDEEKTALLDQSTFNGWLDVYPLKTQNKSGTVKQSPLEQLGEFLAGNE